MSRIFLAVFLILIILQINVLADDQGKSKTAASYLWISPSPRASALGGAFVGLADDVSSIYYNPAGLAQIQKQEFILSSSILGLDRSHNFASYVFSYEKETKDYFMSFRNKKFLGLEKPQYKLIGLGIAWINFGIKNIESYDDFGNELNDFDDMENAFFLSYSMNIYENLFFGLNGKYFNQKLTNAKASGFGLDVGFLFHKPDSKLSYGLSLQNLIGGLKWNIPNEISTEDDTYSERISMSSRLGFAYLITNKNKFLVDLEYTAQQKIRWHTGLEYGLSDRLALRLGMDYYDPSVGFGFRLGKKSFEILADYAYLFDFEDLYCTHHFSLKTRFGSSY